MPTKTTTAAVKPATATNKPINQNVLAAAQSAGKQLGVAPTTLYSQWVNEIGSSLNTKTPANNNLGNIMKPGTGTPQTYSSLLPDAQGNDFVTAFVSFIRSGFPAAQNTGSNVTAYVAGLTNKKGQTYFSGAPGTPGYITGKQYATSILNILSGLSSSLGAQPANLSTTAQANVNASNTGNPLTFGQKVADTLTQGENAATGAQDAAQGAVGNAVSALDPTKWLTPIEGWLSKAVHPVVMFIVGILLVVIGLIVIFKDQIETVAEVAAPEAVPAIEGEKKLTSKKKEGNK
jgi:hypothetical protein